MNLAVFWQVPDVPVLCKAVLTVLGILMLILVRYAERIFDADDDGDYVPCPKYLFYVWIPFFLVAMWAQAPLALYAIVLVALHIETRMRSWFFDGSS